MKAYFTKILFGVIFSSLILSCKDVDVAPLNILGKWKRQSIVGTMTVDGVTKDLNSGNVPGLSDFIIVFEDDGTCISDGEQLEYTLKGTTLTLTESQSSLNLTSIYTGLVINGDILTMNADEIGLKSPIDLMNSISTRKITKMNVKYTFKRQDL